MSNEICVHLLGWESPSGYHTPLPKHPWTPSYLTIYPQLPKGRRLKGHDIKGLTNSWECQKSWWASGRNRWSQKWRFQWGKDRICPQHSQTQQGAGAAQCLNLGAAGLALGKNSKLLGVSTGSEFHGSLLFSYLGFWLWLIYSLTTCHSQHGQLLEGNGCI